MFNTAYFEKHQLYNIRNIFNFNGKGIVSSFFMSMSKDKPVIDKTKKSTGS